MTVGGLRGGGGGGCREGEDGEIQWGETEGVWEGGETQNGRCGAVGAQGAQRSQ